MCCLPCFFAFKLWLVQVPALGSVWAVGRLLLIPSALPSAAVSAEGLLMRFHVEVPALPVLDAVSAVLCAACLVSAHLNCSWCRFLLCVSFGP